MAYLIGAIMAIVVSLAASAVHFDRERVFYPTVLAVIASYYGLFAVMGGSINAMGIESLVMLAFLVAAVLGFKRNLWLVVVALLAHGVFDFFHPHIVHNPGVPTWWPMFCLAYDVMAAAYLAWLLKKSRLTARAAPHGT
ncbi:hypothetical protein [Rhodoferax sp.]|uniref:hypothetical protein n=1 Tax=Rhodoferax sp. TaxID=50421 RepID=UPI002603C5D3|nr:hypothetical protein [Rhodoferax sp.]MDD2923887.1 hypothetical protein [Rhodoferax sp.]